MLENLTWWANIGIDVSIPLEIDDPEANTGHLYTCLRGLDKLVIIIPNTVTVPGIRYDCHTCRIGEWNAGTPGFCIAGSWARYPSDHDSFRLPYQQELNGPRYLHFRDLCR